MVIPAVVCGEETRTAPSVTPSSRVSSTTRSVTSTSSFRVDVRMLVVGIGNPPVVGQARAGWLSMVAGAAFGAATLAALVGRRQLRRPQPSPARDDAPLISVVVPARNEARDVAATLRGVLAQRYPRLEVVAVDDCSDDGTGEAIAAVAAEDSRVTLVRGREAPEGWLGKPWAVSQGVER